MTNDARPEAWLTVDPEAIDPKAMARAADVLRSGGLVAFPTETVYGLGADARDERAVERIFAAKGRPADNPLIVHVPSLAAAREVARSWSELAEQLALRFWPGPLTLLVPRSPHIPAIVSAGLPLVGVRWPAHPIAQAMLEAAGLPVAAPSANPYMGVSPTEGRHVWEGLGARLDLLLDGGSCGVGIESTVLDITAEVPTVLRPGGIGLDDLLEVLPAVRMGDVTVEAGPRLSPGLSKRHYSPRAQVRLIADRDALERLARTFDPATLGVMALGHGPALAPGTHGIAMPADPAAYARRLYASLHDLDAAGVHTILVERPPQTSGWLAINDRLSRAAARQ